MQNKRALTVLLLSMVLMTTASGTALASKNDGNTVSSGGYTIIPASSPSGLIRPAVVFSSIVQGQTNYHTRDIYGYYTSVNVDLNWGNKYNSLSLTIYIPDGTTLGPIYDGADGVIDGRINIYVNNPDGVGQGTWTYKVYGYSVTGTQSYSI